MKKYVIYDTETGGLSPDTASLLTAHFRITDSAFQTLDSLSLTLKPDNGIYLTNARALGVNKINILEHDKTAMTYKEARPVLLHFLSRHSDKGSNKLTPVGHNVAFDEAFVQYHLLTKLEWEAHVSYRKLDTSTIAEFLKVCMILPGSLSGLGEIANFFGVRQIGAHDAAVDVEMTTDILKSMKQRIMRPDNV